MSTNDWKARAKWKVGDFVHAGHNIRGTIESIFTPNAPAPVEPVRAPRAYAGIVTPPETTYRVRSADGRSSEWTTWMLRTGNGFPIARVIAMVAAANAYAKTLSAIIARLALDNVSDRSTITQLRQELEEINGTKDEA